MKKTIYMLAMLLAFQGCKKETFNYALYEADAARIDSVYFSTGSPTLIADGKASLQFVLETYRKVQIESAQGKLKDTMMFVDYLTLPANEIKVYADGQPLSEMEYRTKELNKPSVQFYAQVGNTKSKIKQVQIRQPKEAFVKRYVDVIFHVLELNPTDPAFDPLTNQEITPAHLTQAIAYANEVFANVYGKDPNGGCANVEFRLTKKNAAGATLAQPGYNKITYDATWKTSPTAQFTATNFTTKINATTAYQWDKTKFLNVYIYPISANNTLGNNRAAYQIVPAGQTPLGGITNIVNAEAEVPTNDFFNTYGLGIHRTVFFPGTGKRIEIAAYLGLYYGLYPTHSSVLPITDHVYDTRKYESGSAQIANTGKALLKTGIDGEKFLANNPMDDVRNASLRNSFTQGQVERMRLVMERSPVRKAWFLQ